MKMYVGTDWVDASELIEVINPFDGSVVDTVPKATAADVDRAIVTAMRGAEVMASLTGYERSEILRRAGDLILERVDELAPVITREQGKIIGESRVEATRAAEILYLSAEEAKRLNGEVVPLDGGPGAGGKLGFTLRVPCGVVAAISPFNFPLHLVCHKAGPALAGGNAVIIKPATDTPLSALNLVDILLEAGTPPEAVQCLTGAGSDIGDVLVSDPRVRKITFTGSRDVGEHICKTAGLKKVTMELGIELAGDHHGRRRHGEGLIRARANDLRQRRAGLHFDSEDIRRREYLFGLRRLLWRHCLKDQLRRSL